MENLIREQATTASNELYVGLRQNLVGIDEQAGQLTDILLANGHALLEGIPGTGKTEMLNGLEKIIIPNAGRRVVGRWQGVGDSLPADVTGAMIFDQETGKMIPWLGPVDAHIFFADELNRAPGKTQNAINQAAQEKKVTLRGREFDLPRPFLVVATQNSHEQGEATYPTTSALLDRFLGSVYFGTPTRENKKIVGMRENLERELMTPEEAALADRDKLKSRVTAARLLAVMRVVADIGIEESAVERIIEIEENLVAMKGVALIAGGEDVGMGYRFVNAARRLAKANAVRAGKEIATVEQVDRIAPLVFGHRIRSIDHNSQTAYPKRLEVVNRAMGR